MQVSRVIVHDVPKDRPSNQFCPSCDKVVVVVKKMYADICNDCYLVLTQY